MDEGAPVIVRVGLGLTLTLTLTQTLTKAPATLDLVRIWLAEMQISPNHARVLLALLYMVPWVRARVRGRVGVRVRVRVR